MFNVCTCDSNTNINMKLIKFGLFMSMLSLLLFVIIAASAQEADAESFKKKMKKAGNKMDNLVDCFKYNSFMSKKAMESGKTFHANPNCDPDEQWKYDKLNSGEIADKDMETLLQNEAYGNKDRHDKYNDLEKDDEIRLSDEDDDDDDDNKYGKSITEGSKELSKNIGQGLKDLAR